MNKRFILIRPLIIILLLIIPSSVWVESIHQYDCKVIEFYPYEEHRAFGGGEDGGSVDISTSRCATMIFELSMRGSTFKKGFSKEIRDKVEATFADNSTKTARSVRLKNAGDRIKAGTYTAKACFGRYDFPITKVECKEN